MFGQISGELEVNVPASDAWELYGTVGLAKLAEKELSDYIEKAEITGDGGVGTVVKITFASGTGFASYKEKFTTIDNENRVKETEVCEGGFLDLGFTLYRVRFQIIAKSDDSCIIRSTIEYEVQEDAVVNASMVTIEPFANLAEAAKKFLIKKKAEVSH